MGDEKLLGMRFWLPILVSIAGVVAFEEIDENLYLFLTSHFVPPPPCPENELYKTCFSNCSDCERRGVCGKAEGCGQKGCDCRQNFVRLEPGRRCEPVHRCPVRECDENELFRECGPMCERCGAMRCRMLQCDHKCYCKEGHLREWGGRCVPENECPPKVRCFRDEEKGTSGRKDEYCLEDDAEPSNATDTKDRCYCKEGFSRNPMGHCVADKFCPMIKCMRGEVYQSCPKKCNATCRTYGDGFCEEDGQCFPGCFCPEGLLMDDFRTCVPLWECPPGSNPFAPISGPTSTPAMTESTTSASTASLSTPENDTSGSRPSITVQDSDSSTIPTTVQNSDSSTIPTTVQDSDSSTIPTTVQDSDSSTTPTTVQDSDSSTISTTVQDSDSSTIPTTVQDSESAAQKYDLTSGLPEDVEIPITASTTKASTAVSTQTTETQTATKSPAKFRTTGKPKDRAEEKSAGVTSKAPVQVEEDQKEESSREDVQPTTTEKPKSSKNTAKERKEATKAKKATTPVDMDEENE